MAGFVLLSRSPRPQPGAVMNNQSEFTLDRGGITEGALARRRCSVKPHHGGRIRIQDDEQYIARRRRSSCEARARIRQLATSQKKDDALAVFCHEVRSSLAAIRNAGHILRIQHAETPTGEKARLIIERQAGRMTRLIEDLADISRSNSSELPFQRQRIDLRSVVEQAIETVSSELSARKHRLTTSLPAAPLWLHCDPGRLEQVLVNLLVNSAKYTDDGGELWLSAQQEDDEVIIRVRDSGIGIAPDVLPNVFNLFVQAEHSSRRADAGFGIGLALVRSFVELHGGDVTATSAGLGQGSEFTVSLPMRAADGS